jgi:hypothetical protein
MSAKRRIALIIAAILALAVGSGGAIAFAQGDDSSSTPSVARSEPAGDDSGVSSSEPAGDDSSVSSVSNAEPAGDDSSVSSGEPAGDDSSVSSVSSDDNGTEGTGSAGPAEATTSTASFTG